jgi:hypothetical protein
MTLASFNESCLLRNHRQRGTIRCTGVWRTRATYYFLGSSAIACLPEWDWARFAIGKALDRAPAF